MRIAGLRIGTRGSQLALAQTDLLKAALQAVYPHLPLHTEIISTAGDQLNTLPLAEAVAIGGKGLFTAALERALLQGQIDCAVHSLKDLPGHSHPDFVLAAILPRANPFDALIALGGQTLAGLPTGAVVGSSSPRRAAQLWLRRPDLQIVPLRGNVPTRLAKLQATGSPYQAIVLAVAGLARLNLAEQASQILAPPLMLPAPGQGAIAVQCLASQSIIRELLAKIDDAPTRAAVTAERAFMRRLEAGCSLPIAAWASLEGDTITLTGRVLDPQGRRAITVQQSGSLQRPEQLGWQLAEQALALGAAKLMQ
jgi:hydroxymethylbilane synthase